LYIPYSYNQISLKSNKSTNFEVYNSKRRIKLPIGGKAFFFDENSNCIVVQTTSKNLNSIVNKLNKLMHIFESTFFDKIKFKGKGFRTRFKKNSKIIKFTFGHSHINYVFINNNSIKIKRLGKYKYTFKSKDRIKMNLLLQQICKIKPINMYTKRGIRLGRQVIFKRKGKKSTYI
jgi:ribosomal protein L6P/L9E